MGCTSWLIVATLHRKHYSDNSFSFVAMPAFIRLLSYLTIWQRIDHGHIMKLTAVLAATVMTLLTLSPHAFAKSEDVFWQWFAANETRIFNFETDQTIVFDQLTKELSRVNNDLTFEFGPVRAGKREFVISAGGIREAFPSVEALYAKAPPLKRWIWVKYRPRRLPINDIAFGGRQIRAADVRYVLTKDGERAGIVLFFDKYSKDEDRFFGQVGYLLLDEALGEYAIETKVGYIEFQSRDSKYFPRSRPLNELPEHFDEYFGGRSP
jgi:hypothetical protein